MSSIVSLRRLHCSVYQVILDPGVLLELVIFIIRIIAFDLKESCDVHNINGLYVKNWVSIHKYIPSRLFPTGVGRDYIVPVAGE